MIYVVDIYSYIYLYKYINIYVYIALLSTDSLLVIRGSGVCELWRYVYAFVATGREWALPVQRVRPLLQNEWSKPAADQAEAKIGMLDY